MKVFHPATYSDAILRYLANGSQLPEGRILDPFAGVGKIHRLADADRFTVGVEIEEVWARQHPGNVVADALHLPFHDECFDGCVTSPVYGNRMSDHHRAKDPSLRRSYTHDLQRSVGDASRQLHPANSGVLYAWQPAYWTFHRAAWQEVHRVLKPGAKFLLNVSDCWRTVKGQRTIIPVVDRHVDFCVLLVGFVLDEIHRIETPRMKYGANGHRVPHEVVLEMTKAG